MRDFNRPACNRYKTGSVEVIISQYSIACSEKKSKVTLKHKSDSFVDVIKTIVTELLNL